MISNFERQKTYSELKLIIDERLVKTCLIVSSLLTELVIKLSSFSTLTHFIKIILNIYNFYLLLLFFVLERSEQNKSNNF